jgi:hypothetical protein
MHLLNGISLIAPYLRKVNLAWAILVKAGFGRAGCDALHQKRAIYINLAGLSCGGN